jgi:threonine dehydrogenase-like Zn-dependent dehydrogenase
MPQDCCYPVPKDFSLANCVMCEPLTIGYYCVQQADLRENADIAILGAGPIGLSCLLNANTKKINACYMTDRIDCRVKAAQGAGAAWSGNPDKTNIVEAILTQQPAGMDAVFECAGQLETLDQALEILKPGGKLMMVGIPREERVTFIIDKMRRKEITLVNIRRQNGCTQKLIDLMVSGKINADFMFTHSFKLADIQKAFDMAAKYDDGVIKAMSEI